MALGAGADVDVGVALALRVGVALAGPDAPAVEAAAVGVVARTEGVRATGAADLTEGATADALPGPPSGAWARAEDPSVARRVRSRSPRVPSGDEERAKPAISAAADAAPTAPTATATRLERRPAVPRAARRRSARPGRGAAGAIRGSSRVSSYALSQPCADAGSRYSPYAGAGSPWDW
ncbi:hypothetical protein ACGFZS_12115 [Streptomyces sp. NPDC048288]|uniref:hypothetical protein n=1 Tax=Streptomyces sp. NPDC048288 TaxID=3365529 RepID=UPI003711E96F